MTRNGAQDWQLNVELPATLQAGEEFFAEFRPQIRALLSRSQAYRAELLLREVVTNAVTHGCHEDAGKKIRCRLRLRNGSLMLAVSDEGLGFDWRSVRMRSSLLENTSGRGMEILRAYASHFRFNDRGNAVAILQRYQPKDSQS